MAAVPPRSERRPPRPGSLARPVNGRLYRGTWLLVGLPLLVAAFSVARPEPLPPPQLPPAFDGRDATGLATELAGNYPNRFPGSPGAVRAASWFRNQLRPYGLETRTERFTAVIPGHGRVRLTNLVSVVAGRSPQEIVVLAHRDDDGTSAGANDNASGTAALLELARAYSAPRGTLSVRLKPAHTIVFLSTDGGAFGSLGAAEFAAHSPERHGVIAAVNLDAIAGPGQPRLEIAGDTSRTASGTLLATAAARVARQTGTPTARPKLLAQLIDLGFPFSLYEQAPLISHGVPAVSLTTGGDRSPAAVSHAREQLDAVRFGQIGHAAQDLVQTLDQGLEFAQGTSSYLYLGSRLIRGWALQLVLMSMLLPFLAAAVDLFARCRRRRIPLAPALRAYRSRLAFWVWVAAVFELLTLVGIWPEGAARPPSPATDAARHWPAAGLLLLGVLTLVGWLVARDRLIPRRRVTTEEELAGHTAALLCVAAVALLVVVTNPFALLFVLPSAHAWLWLPNLRRGSPSLRAGVLALGFLGPALVFGSFAFRYDMGWDAFWYVAELRALGYVPFAVVPIMVAWLAGAGQLAALASGRYAPYPAAWERPRFGPVRRVIRRLVLRSRARRQASRRVAEHAREAGADASQSRRR
jgi:hypothetical protein